MYDVKKKSSAQEKKVAKEVGGRTTPASGAIENFKGDVRSSKYLIECKTTEKSWYPLVFETWEKIYLEALNDGFRIPVMCIELQNGTVRLAVIENDTIHYSALKCGPFKGIAVYPKSPRSSIRIKPDSAYSTLNLVNGKKNVRGITHSLYPDINLTIVPWIEFLKYKDELCEWSDR